jgi:hypothetical protein
MRDFSREEIEKGLDREGIDEDEDREGEGRQRSFLSKKDNIAFASCSEDK